MNFFTTENTEFTEIFSLSVNSVFSVVKSVTQFCQFLNGTRKNYNFYAPTKGYTMTTASIPPKLPALSSAPTLSSAVGELPPQEKVTNELKSSYTMGRGKPKLGLWIKTVASASLFPLGIMGATSRLIPTGGGPMALVAAAYFGSVYVSFTISKSRKLPTPITTVALKAHQYLTIPLTNLKKFEAKTDKGLKEKLSRFSPKKLFNRLYKKLQSHKE
jgi:hypothetical protein